MIGRLADTDHAVMARRAVAGDAGVLEYRLGKVRRVVAERAVLCRRYVGYQFAGADDVVVARGTIIDDAGVIEDATGERGGGVAERTIFNRWHMVVRLAERTGPVMAGIAAD